MPTVQLRANDDERSLGRAALLARVEQGRRQLALPLLDLWLRYAALGGTRSFTDVEEIMHGGPVPAGGDHHLLRAALDERLAELKRPRPRPSD